MLLAQISKSAWSLELHPKPNPKSLFTWGEISRGAGISRVPEISRGARVSLFWKLVRSHETGITRLDYPGYPGYPGQLLSMWTLCTGISRGAGTISTVMRMTSIRTWKPTWRKLQMPNVNTHNMQEEIHLIDIEQRKYPESIEKTDKTKFLLNTMHLCTFKIQFSQVLFWRVEIAPG